MKLILPVSSPYLKLLVSINFRVNYLSLVSKLLYKSLKLLTKTAAPADVTMVITQHPMLFLPKLIFFRKADSLLNVCVTYRSDK